MFTFKKKQIPLTNIITQLTKTMCENMEFVNINQNDVIKIYNKEKSWKYLSRTISFSLSIFTYYPMSAWFK